MKNSQIIILMLIAALVACKNRKPSSPGVSPNSSSDASGDYSLADKFCKDHGGLTETFKAVDGSAIRACVFGRARIEIISLLNAKQSQASTRFFSPLVNEGRAATSGANPASINCEKNGGQGKSALDQDGEFSFCSFSDGSMIEEWTLFRGPNDIENAKLKAALEAARK